MGALLVTVAMVGVFVLSKTDEGPPATEYLVLRSGVDAGDQIDLTDVSLVAMNLPDEVAATALRSTDGLEGATALAYLRDGSLLDIRDLRGAAIVQGAAIGAIHELTLPVPTDRAPADLRRGDRVTMLAYSASARDLRTAVEDALVLTYDSGPSDGFSNSNEGRLTLALDNADDVVALTLLSYDSLTVVLTSRSVDDAYPARLDRDIDTTIPGEAAA